MQKEPILDQLISISLLVLLIALLLPVLTRLVTQRHRRLFQYGIFFAYVIANLYETILFRPAADSATYKLEALWSYRRSIALDNGVLGIIERLLSNGLTAALDGILITDSGLLLEILLNILLYVPLGYLLPYVWPGLLTKSFGKTMPKPEQNEQHCCRKCLLTALLSPWRLWLIGMLASTATELTQLIFHIGLFEFDDIISNTMGCVAGSIIYMLSMRRKLKFAENDNIMSDDEKE